MYIHVYTKAFFSRRFVCRKRLLILITAFYIGGLHQKSEIGEPPNIARTHLLRSTLLSADPKRARTFQVTSKGIMFCPMHTWRSCSLTDVVNTLAHSKHPQNWKYVTCFGLLMWEFLPQTCMPEGQNTWHFWALVIGFGLLFALWMPQHKIQRQTISEVRSLPNSLF